jgi:hypothetical protein
MFSSGRWLGASRPRVRMPVMTLIRDRYTTAGLALILVTLAGCKQEVPPLPDSKTSTSKPAEATEAPPQSERKALVAPHKGRLLPVTAQRGYIEWICHAGDNTARIYFLDMSLQPLGQVAGPTLWLAGPSGPQEVALSPCPDDPDGGCLLATSDMLRESAPQGVLRFSIHGARHRVLLPAQSVDSQPTPPSASSIASQRAS